MTESSQRIQNIQKDTSKEQQEYDDTTIEEMVQMAVNKSYKDKNGYYPPKLLAQIIPECYINISFNTEKFTNYSEETLFYIFYAFPCEEIQKSAFKALLQRGHVYSKLYKNFLILEEPKTVDNKKHNVLMFDPFIWSKFTREVVYDERFMSTLEKL